MGVCPLLPSPFLWPALKDTQYAAKLWIMACGRDQWRRKGISQFWWASTKIGDDQVFVWKLSPQPDMIVCRTETLSVKQFLSHWMQKLGTMLPTCYICYGRVQTRRTCNHDMSPSGYDPHSLSSQVGRQLSTMSATRSSISSCC